ncbi:hypothetical protein JB92DRAFT_3118641 [Gautieria morchelliformis]|nr:hypothetical protein JB92DRAFT_3118641 [Gautieria morchelliformis]
MTPRNYKNCFRQWHPGGWMHKPSRNLCLNVSLHYYSRADNRKVSLVVQHVLEECPEINHFERVWPIKALIQQFLKNSSELKPASARWQEERLARLPREEPQALSVANTTSASNSMTKSTSTRKLGSMNKGTASCKGSMMGARKASEPTGKGSTTGAGKSSEPTGKGSTMGARKSSESTGKGLTTGAGKPCANFRSVGNHDQTTNSMKRKTPEDGEPSIPVAKHYKTLEDVPAPMHAKRAASKAGATNKSAPRKTAPKKADPEPRNSKRQTPP